MKTCATILVVLSLAVCLAKGASAQVVISPGGSSAHPSAALDVNFSDKGLLPPRVELQSVNLASPVNSPASGLIVYNTATSGTTSGQVTPGYYCWQGNRWNRMSLPAGTTTGDILYWNGSQWTILAPGQPGQRLWMSHEGIPAWTGSTFPVVITQSPATNITTNSVTTGGEITASGGSPVTLRGVCWGTLPNPVFAGNHTVDGSGTGAFTTELTGLNEGTTYHVRAYAKSETGTAYGSDVSFTTLVYIAPPTVETTGLTNLTPTSAVSGGNVTSQGGAAVTSRGVCWNTSPNPTISDPHTSDGSGTGTFTSNVEGLSPFTTYYLRAYATNSGGTSYGNQLSFTTPPGSGGGTPCPGMSEVYWEGTTYPTVQIGSQCWLKTNLDAGTMISGSQDQLNNGIVEKYCYDNLPSNCAEYGGLYQWAEAVQYLNGATNTTSWSPVPSGFVQGICPSDWHIPSMTDWSILIGFLGGPEVAGGKLKETGFVHWAVPNTGASNLSGFTALPGGMRDFNGMFTFLTLRGYFWSSTEAAPVAAFNLMLDFNSASASLLSDLKAKGFSVRCLRNY